MEQNPKSKQFLSLEHWNKKILLAIDVKTNSPCFVEGQIVEIGAIFVDIYGKIIDEQAPLSLLIKPNYKANLSQKEFDFYTANGVDETTARNTLMYWLDNSVVCHTKWGTKRQAMLVGFEMTKYYAFLAALLGNEYCNEMFHETIRDVQGIAMYINDVHAMIGDKVKFEKYDYKWIMQRCPDLTVPLKEQIDCITRAYGSVAMYISMTKRLLRPMRES